MSLSSWKFFLCLAALAFLVGCQDKGADVGATAVTGTVTLDGQPVEGASVSFSPKSADGRAAAGITDASGRFSLTTVTSGDGAMPGSYAVAVSKTTSSGGPAASGPPPDMSKMTPEEIGAMSQAAMNAEPAVITEELPVKYKTAADSGLTAEVKKGEKNKFTFELTAN